MNPNVTAAILAVQQAQDAQTNAQATLNIALQALSAAALAAVVPPPAAG